NVNTPKVIAAIPRISSVHQRSAISMKWACSVFILHRGANAVPSDSACALLEFELIELRDNKRGIVTMECPNDEQVQRDVLAELKWDSRVQPNEIGVIVKEGIATLRGGVDSYTKKWAAEEAATRARGVAAGAQWVAI